MHFALDCLYLLGGLLASPWLLWRRFRGAGRAGANADAPDTSLPEGAIWLHGASVGEVSLIRPLVQLFERARPGLPLIVSSHTATGVESARRAYPAHRAFRLPFDWSWRQRRLMERLKPCLLVVVESDFWPNHLLAAERASVPVAVINAKLSERSFRLHRLSRIVPRALRSAACIAAQSEAHAARFRALGPPADRIAVTGNMKYDLTADGVGADQRTRLRRQLGIDADALVVIGGSLHPGEDRDLLAAFAAVTSSGRSLPRSRPSAFATTVKVGCKVVRDTLAGDFFSTTVAKARNGTGAPVPADGRIGKLRSCSTFPRFAGGAMTCTSYDAPVAGSDQ